MHERLSQKNVEQVGTLLMNTTWLNSMIHTGLFAINYTDIRKLGSAKMFYKCTM